MKSLGASVVSRTRARRLGVVRNRRGRIVGKPMAPEAYRTSVRYSRRRARKTLSALKRRAAFSALRRRAAFSALSRRAALAHRALPRRVREPDGPRVLVPR